MKNTVGARDMQNLEGTNVSSSVIGAMAAQPPKVPQQAIHLERARGMMLGSALGDALGLPVETLTPDQVRERYGRLMHFESPRDNPFTNGLLTEPGSTSDDFQLTCAVAEAIARAGTEASPETFLEVLGQCHLEEYRRSSVGWGGSTIDGVRELESAGSMQSLLSQARTRPKAEGNGVAMKIAPLAFFELLAGKSAKDLESIIYATAAFTHPSPMAVASGFAQVAATKYCLEHASDTFAPMKFIEAVVDAARIGERYFPEAQRNVLLSDKLAELPTIIKMSPDAIVRACGGGSSYVYNSLPFSYAFFVKNPGSFETLIDVVNAGGDADSNGSIVGTLLGSLHGGAIFPEQLTSQLPSAQKAQIVAERFLAALVRDVR